MIERNVVFERGQLYIVGVAVRAGEEFGVGSDDGALNFGNIDVEHVVGVFDDAGLQKHDKFATLFLADVSADEVLEDRYLAQHRNSGAPFAVFLPDEASQNKDGTVGNGDLGLELLRGDVWDFVSADEGGAFDAVVELADIEGDFIAGVDQRPDVEGEDDIFVFDAGIHTGCVSGYDRRLLVGRDGNAGAAGDGADLIVGHRNVGLGEQF